MLIVHRYLCYIQRIKTLNCCEAGFECYCIVKGQSEEEVMKNGADHAIREHGMKP
jgi:predicted small metal-binding protein